MFGVRKVRLSAGLVEALGGTLQLLLRPGKNEIILLCPKRSDFLTLLTQSTPVYYYGGGFSGGFQTTFGGPPTPPANKLVD